MTRTHLTGLLLAALTMTAGTVAIVRAQADGAADAAHDHEHSSTSVHAKDGTHFDLTDEAAYPDPDGFESMTGRVSYAIGRDQGPGLTMSDPDLNLDTFGAAVGRGLNEENSDYAQGYARGFQLSRELMQQGSDDLDMDAFVAGFVEAMKEEDNSTSFGYLFGNSMREQNVELDVQTFIAGMKDATPPAEPAEGVDPAPQAELKLSDEQVRETIDAFIEFLIARQRDEAIAEGQAFIDGLKEEDGWKKTESGLAYKVIEEGEGESPDENDIVTAHYEGSLTDGTVFQSSFGGQPLVRPANRLIDGWTEVLQLMKPGATYEIVLPQDMAYGEQGSPPAIPPYATLKFKIQLLSVQPVPNDAPQQAPGAAPGQ